MKRRPTTGILADNEGVRVKPDRRESVLGIALCVVASALGAAFSWSTDGGFLPIYIAGLAAIGVAALLPVKFRPWPVFPVTVPMILWGLAAIFIPVVGGATILALINVPLAAIFVAGSLVLFDAAW
jgi:hypothetical protein